MSEQPFRAAGLHAGGVKEISPGLSEAIPGVLSPLFLSHPGKGCEDTLWPTLDNNVLILPSLF
jgi:hypothetical protein